MKPLRRPCILDCPRLTRSHIQESNNVAVGILFGVPLTVVENTREFRLRTQGCEDRVAADRKTEGSDFLGLDSARPGLMSQKRVDDGGELTRTAIQDDALDIADVVAEVVPGMQRRSGDERIGSFLPTRCSISRATASDCALPFSDRPGSVSASQPAAASPWRIM